MAKPILMPQIGENIEAGKIIEWLVKVGDTVNEGDIIVVVESEKATFEVEAYESGTIGKILYSDGDEAEVLKPIAYFAGPGEEPVESPQPEKAEQKTTDVSQKEVVPQKMTTKSSRFASPSARRIAKEKKIDLNNISGSGPNGRIIKRDVLAAIELTSSAKSDTAEDRERPFSRIRQVIADRLTRSKQTIPHFYLFSEVDMTGGLVWRKAYNEKNNVRITITDMIVKAVASALSKFERINAHADSEKIILKSNVNIGVAVSIEDGILVPVVPDADQKDIQEISRICKSNAEAARRGSLRSSTPGTFTITNLGMYSISRFMPIINPPECAILGVGSIEKKVIAIDGGIHIRDIINLCIACDHRAVDGVYAAQFMNRVKELLEDYRIL